MVKYIVLQWSWIFLWKCWFLRGGKNWSTQRKTSRSWEENQQQTQPAYAAATTLVAGEHSHHSAFPAPPSLYTRLTFFLRRHGHLTADFLLHSSGERQGPAWQLEEHLWPQVAKFFGHWFLHDISSFFVCSSADVNSLQEKRQKEN